MESPYNILASLLDVPRDLLVEARTTDLWQSAETAEPFGHWHLRPDFARARALGQLEAMVLAAAQQGSHHPVHDIHVFERHGLHMSGRTRATWKIVDRQNRKVYSQSFLVPVGAGLRVSGLLEALIWLNQNPYKKIKMAR